MDESRRTNQRRATVTVPAKKGIRSIELADRIWMDADSTNNRWTVR
jgi:hypothetical protein